MLRPVVSRSALMQSRQSPLVFLTIKSISFPRLKKADFRGHAIVASQECRLAASRATEMLFEISIKFFLAIDDHSPTGSKPASLRILTNALCLVSREQNAEIVGTLHFKHKLDEIALQQLVHNLASDAEGKFDVAVWSMCSS
jgi:hypothetical protein